MESVLVSQGIITHLETRNCLSDLPSKKSLKFGEKFKSEHFHLRTARLSRLRASDERDISKNFNFQDDIQSKFSEPSMEFRMSIKEEQLPERYSNTAWEAYEKAIDSAEFEAALEILKSLNKLQNIRNSSEGNSGPFLTLGGGGSSIKNDGPSSLEDKMQRDKLKIPNLTSDWDTEVLPRDEVLQIFSEDEKARSLKILDRIISAKNMQFVSRAYSSLFSYGIIPNFGKFNLEDESDIPRVVTPKIFKEIGGISGEKLSPKKWGSSSPIIPVVFFTAISALLYNGIDVRPTLSIALVLAIADAIFLGGATYNQVMSMWKPYQKRILVHEAGHVLAAYLLGCPIRGVILDPMEALKTGIQGQAGTQFWDSTIESELQSGNLTSSSIDRYCVVLFAGVAAEALVYGEAEGGESDENLFKAFLGGLQPAWSIARISNQARWSVLQAYRMLRKYEACHKAIVEKLEEEAPLGEIVSTIESVLSK